MGQDSTQFDGYRDMMLCLLHTGENGLRIIGEVQIIDRRMFRLKHKVVSQNPSDAPFNNLLC
jgi:hypothetical protein